MSSTNIKEELDLEVENSNDKGNSKTGIRLLEFRMVNSIDSTYWRNVENQLRLEGKYFRTGHFSEAENSQLKKNWNKLIKKYPHDNPVAILRKNICPDAKEIIKDFLNATNFYINLGHKINRSPYAVYARARKLFNDVERVGKYTEDEVEKLQDLEFKLGNKWQEIGRELKRCPSSATKKCHSLKKEVVKGRWTDEEDKQLKDAVSAIMNEKKEEGVKKKKEETFFKLPWEKISEHVPSRNAKQCRERWMLHEQIGDNKTKSKKRNKKFGKLQKLKLVDELISLNPIDESAIDWMQLLSHFPDVPSPQGLYLKWYDIKRIIPKYKLMALKEILAIAKEKIMASYIKDEIIDDDSDDDDCNETNKKNQSQNISGASKSKSKTFSQVDEASRNGDTKLEDLDIRTEDEDDDDHCQVENADDDAIGICIETMKVEPSEEDVLEEKFLQDDSDKKKKSKKSKRLKTEDVQKDDYCQEESADDDAIEIYIETVKMEPKEEDVSEENFLQNDSDKKKKSKKSLKLKTEDVHKGDYCQEENIDDDAIGICIETVKVEPDDEVYEENHPLDDSGKNTKSKKSKKSKNEEKDESVEVTAFKPAKTRKRKNETPTEDAETNEGSKGKRKKLFRNHQTPLRENSGR